MTYWTLYDRLQTQFGQTAERRNAYPTKLTAAQLQKVFNHQRWLATEERFGKQLVIGKREFERADLDGVDLTRAVLSDVSFAFSDLRHARFVGAQFKNVSFFGCDLEGCDFTDASFTRVNWDQAVNKDRAVFGSTQNLSIEAADLKI